jgi:hypothetical protein
MNRPDWMLVGAAGSASGKKRAATRFEFRLQEQLRKSRVGLIG